MLRGETGSGERGMTGRQPSVSVVIGVEGGVSVIADSDAGASLCGARCERDAARGMGDMGGGGLAGTVAARGARDVGGDDGGALAGAVEAAREIVPGTAGRAGC
jgi:hypothetical protein